MASGVTKLSHSRRWRGCRGHAFVKRRRCYAPRKKEVAISLIRKETDGRTRTTSSYQYSLIISPNMICEYADSATGREVRLCCYPRMLPSFTEWLTMECSRKTIQVFILMVARPSHCSSRKLYGTRNLRFHMSKKARRGVDFCDYLDTQKEWVCSMSGGMDECFSQVVPNFYLRMRELMEWKLWNWQLKYQCARHNFSYLVRYMKFIGPVSQGNQISPRGLFFQYNLNRKGKNTLDFSCGVGFSSVQESIKKLTILFRAGSMQELSNKLRIFQINLRIFQKEPVESVQFGLKMPGKYQKLGSAATKRTQTRRLKKDTD
ncbi:unnamed protein product, partial [Nesidiocoris tenuis]